MKPLRPNARGLGLVEVMMAVVVLGVLLAVATPSLLDMLERRRVTAVGLEIASILNFARSEANLNGEKMTVHLEKDPNGVTSCASVNVEHVSDFCKCYLPAATMCGSKVKIDVLRLFQIKNADGVSFEATANPWGPKPNQLKFSRVAYYDNATDVQVNVKGRRTGAQFRVELNHANRVRICTPDGSITGYPKC